MTEKNNETPTIDEVTAVQESSHRVPQPSADRSWGFTHYRALGDSPSTTHHSRPESGSPHSSPRHIGIPRTSLPDVTRLHYSPQHSPRQSPRHTPQQSPRQIARQSVNFTPQRSLQEGATHPHFSITEARRHSVQQQSPQHSPGEFTPSRESISSTESPHSHSPSEISSMPESPPEVRQDLLNDLLEEPHSENSHEQSLSREESRQGRRTEIAVVPESPTDSLQEIPENRQSDFNNDLQPESSPGSLEDLPKQHPSEIAHVQFLQPPSDLEPDPDPDALPEKHQPSEIDRVQFAPSASQLPPSQNPQDLESHSDHRLEHHHRPSEISRLQLPFEENSFRNDFPKDPLPQSPTHASPDFRVPQLKSPEVSPQQPVSLSPSLSPSPFHHASIDVEPSPRPPSSHGLHLEVEESAVPPPQPPSPPVVHQQPPASMSTSIPYAMLSFFSAATDKVLDFILPPLPPEPSAAAEIQPAPQSESGTAVVDSQAQESSGEEGRVAFAVDDEQIKSPEPSPSPVRNAREDSRFELKKKRLSSRFYKPPASIVQEEKVYTRWEILYYAYQTLGIVYGDLGTSPLYVYPTINFQKATEQDFLGILSVIFWTLTLIGVFKYTLIVLLADDHGEGGTFATYSLLCQYANIAQHPGEYNPVVSMDGKRLSHFYNVEDTPNNRAKLFLQGSRRAQHVLLFVAMLATCMLIGDGMLTPAISVLSAIEGVKVASPRMSNVVILVISSVILVLLFLVQRFGTSRVSLIFSPVMVAWFTTTPLIGLYNIVKHYPRVFKAFSPAHIVYFFRDNGKEAWLQLGGTVLCITGAEAMYADMGHFNKRSIQVAFCLMVYPSVLLTYSGQTSYLIKHPEDHRDGFYKMIPHHFFWPMFIISTLAAIVASQGLITATFSVIKQSVALNYFPPVKLVHTSDDQEGQIYSPEVNYVLMALCLAVVFGFRSAATIGNAFGVAVVFVMLITTCLMCLVMLVIWRWHWFTVLWFFIVYVALEFVYITSVVTKVPQGGWLPFVVSILVTVVMFSWNMGCQAKYRYEMDNQITRHRFANLLRDVGSVRVPGICFFYTDLMSGVPPIVQHYISNVRSLHRVLVFTTVRFLPVKTVLPEERFLVGRVGFEGVYRCVARYGYRDVMKYRNNEFVDQFLSTLEDYIHSVGIHPERKSILSTDDDVALSQTAIEAEIDVLNQAREDGPVYVMGRGELEVTKETRFITRVVVGTLYRFLKANFRSNVSTMDIPYEQYLEIGMAYRI